MKAHLNIHINCEDEISHRMDCIRGGEPYPVIIIDNLVLFPTVDKLHELKEVIEKAIKEIGDE